LTILKGEVICVRFSNGQSFYIFDLAWFLEILNNYISTAAAASSMETTTSQLEFDKIKNFHFIRYDSIKTAGFMDKLKIADVQQSELLLQLLKHFTAAFVNYKSESDNFILIRNLPMAKNTNEVIYIDQVVE
jgi:hypothetical protein